MGAVVEIWDRLTNALSGKGTTVDRRAYNAYAWIPVAPQQAEAWYRGTWLGRKSVDIIPTDMTREGRDWQTDAANIEKIEAEERRLQLWPKLLRVLILARLYGGGGIVLGTTDDSDPAQPINPNRVKAGGLKFIQVYSRHQLSEGGNQRLDPGDEWFGHPDFWTITATNGQQLKLHPSRVVAFIGQRPPEGSQLSGISWFWGDPLLQSVKQAVENADSAQDGFADLIAEAKIDILKIPDLAEIAGTPEGETLIANRAQASMVGKSMYRTLFMDASEDYEQKQITWAGMPDIMMALLQTVSGATDIPITRFLGTSPKGLQSTGDGEERDYHATIGARQEMELRPGLERIDELLIRSALGSKPSDVYWEFAALRDIDEKDAATIEFQFAQAFKMRADTGMLPESALAAIERNRMQESGRYPGSEAAFEEAEAAGDDPTDPASQPNEADLPAIETVPPANPQPKGKRKPADA